MSKNKNQKFDSHVNYFIVRRKIPGEPQRYDEYTSVSDIDLPWYFKPFRKKLIRLFGKAYEMGWMDNRDGLRFNRHGTDYSKLPERPL